MWWMHHAAIVLRYERALNKKARSRFRSGIDSNQGADYPGTRPFFNMSVGPDESLDEAWSIAPKSVSTEDVLKASNDQFHSLEDNMEVLTRVLRGTVDVRYKRLDAKLNTIFRMLRSTKGRGMEMRSLPTAEEEAEFEEGEQEAGSAGGSSRQLQSSRLAQAPAASMQADTAQQEQTYKDTHKDTSKDTYTAQQKQRGAQRSVDVEGPQMRASEARGSPAAVSRDVNSLVPDADARPPRMPADLGGDSGDGGQRLVLPGETGEGGGGDEGGGKWAALPQNLVQDLFRYYDREQQGWISREHVVKLFLEVCLWCVYSTHYTHKYTLIHTYRARGQVVSRGVSVVCILYTPYTQIHTTTHKYTHTHACMYVHA